MPNGTTGTGISIIFYLLLALLMPVVFIVRIIKKSKSFKWKFVAMHFTYAVLIACTILLGVSYLTKISGLEGSGELHKLLTDGARVTSCILLIWAITPLLLRLWLRVVHGSRYRSELSELMTSQIKKRPIRSKYLVIDGIMSHSKWERIRQQLHSKPNLANKN